MCFAPLRPAGPPRWVRLLELAGGVVLVAVVIAAVMTLRGRSDSLALVPPTLESAPVNTPASLGQLALGGTATTFPTLTLTTVPPTRTPPPPVTQSPTQEVGSATPTPLPQTGGPPPNPDTTYIIRPGDSLLAIAIQHNISLEQLLDANGMNNVNVLILPGQTLKIPTGDASATVPPPAAPPAEPTSAPAVQAPAPAEPVNNDPVGRITHTVRAGDSLWTIANRYGKTVDDLVALNGFKSVNQFLGIGDELLIDPGVTPTPRPPTDTPPPPTEAPSATATPQPTDTPAPTNTPVPTNTAEPTRQIAEATTAATTPAQAAVPGTPIALARYPAPTLLGVPDKTTLQGKAPTLLNWTSVGVLAADEYYVIRVSTTRDGKPMTEEAWVKATGWRLPETMLPTEKTTTPMVYTWDVTVRRATDHTPEGKPSGPAISPTSPVYEFTWTP